LWINNVNISNPFLAPPTTISPPRKHSGAKSDKHFKKLIGKLCTHTITKKESKPVPPWRKFEKKEMLS